MSGDQASAAGSGAAGFIGSGDIAGPMARRLLDELARTARAIGIVLRASTLGLEPYPEG